MSKTEQLDNLFTRSGGLSPLVKTRLTCWMTLKLETFLSCMPKCYMSIDIKI